jgi:hypothetical protein
VFRIFGICEDPKIQVHEEEMSNFEINSILKLVVVKDVLPSTLPIKNVRSFAEICRHFIFPFISTSSSNASETVDDRSSGPMRGPSSKGL